MRPKQQAEESLAFRNEEIREYVYEGRKRIAAVWNLVGDASQMTNTNETSHVSSSKQLAARISGAFNHGFELDGENRVISGSVTSTGSFTRVFSNVYSGDASDMFGVNESGHFSGSAQLASNISGSFTSGFGYDGTIQTTPGGVFSTDASLGRTARFLGGLGAVNAGFAIAGQAVNTPQTLTEEYDGSSFSEGGALPAAAACMGTAGTVNAGFIALADKTNYFVSKQIGFN